MYGSWTENVALWRNFLGCIYPMRHLKSSIWVVTFWESIFLILLNNDDEKYIKNSTASQLDV